MTSVASTAIEYLARGWSVFPLKDKRTPHVPWKPCQTERPDIITVGQQWTQFPDAYIGVALGQVSGIIRIDAEGPVPWEQFGPIPETAEFTTPSGGRGYLLRHMEGTTTAVLWKGEGHSELRVQSTGAYTVLPPSPGYEWVRQEPIAGVPLWLRDYYVEQMLREVTKEIRPTLREPNKSEIQEALQHIPADDYDTWIQVGMALKPAGDEYLEEWREWSMRSAKYVEGECEKKWTGFHGGADGLTARTIFWLAERYGYIPPNRHEPLTERGNANMLARMAENKIAHSSFWGWLAFDGTRWVRGGDAEKYVQELQKRVIEQRLEAAVKSLAKHMKTSREAEGFLQKQKRKIGTVRAIYGLDRGSCYRESRGLASSLPEVSIDYQLFDKKPMLLNCINGTVDLATGELRAHDVSDRVTQLCPVEYDPHAECPLWHSFLEQILPDMDVRAYLAKFFGCCVSGDVTAQIMPVFWGGGANGKSTLVQTIFHVMGEDYSMKAKRDLLISKKNSEHPTSIARLHGKRFVACVETDEMGRLDEPLLKELTGDDTIAARRMREDEWQFQPTHKLVLATNHKPEIRGTDDGIWRRIPLIPFTQTFLPDDPRRDPDLKLKLQAEAPGILTWMINGCRVWLEDGKRLHLPAPVKQATTDYKHEQDRIGQFIEDRCNLSPDFKVRDTKLQEAYSAWCINNNVRVRLDNRKFGEALRSRGVTKKQGEKYYQGIKVSEE